jgi:ATP synthase protein I
MPASYATVLRRSAVATAPAAVVMTVLCVAIGGAKGLIGALVAVGLVAVFFGITVIAMSWASQRSPQVMMATAAGAYLVKILVLLFLVVRFSNITAFNGKLFGLTAVVCVVVWTTAQALVTAKLKVPYVEPDGER